MHQVMAKRMKMNPSVWLVLLITLLFGCSRDKDHSAAPVLHLSAAIEAMSAAEAITNNARWGKTGKEGPEQISTYYKIALDEARLIDFAALNKDYPALGDHCQQELLRGLELIVEGDQKIDVKISSSGHDLFDRFLAWYAIHMGEILKATTRR